MSTERSSASFGPRVLERVRNLGTESALEVLAQAAELRKRGCDIVNLGVGQPDFAPPQGAVEAAVKALRDGHHGYTNGAGVWPLREAIADGYRRFHGVSVSPDRVVVTPGGKMVVYIACLMFGCAGKRILYPDPGFPIYRSAASFSGAVAQAYPLRAENDFAFRASDVLERMDEDVCLVILNSPGNPSGQASLEDELDRLVAGLERYPGAAVLSDEIYSRLLYGDARHVSLLGYEQVADRCIVLDGFSKAYGMTGWRVGYGIWPRSWCGFVVRMGMNSYSCVNAAAQYGAVAALTGPQDSVSEMVRAYGRRRDFLVDGLRGIDGVDCHRPVGAFFVFARIGHPAHRTSESLRRALLLDSGLAVVAGTSFGEQGEGYLRFSYAVGQSDLEEGLNRLRKFLDK